MLENRAAALLVGSDILNLVTTGMYQTPPRDLSRISAERG